MASTFSPSLKLTLMGDGDQAGLWGQTTNTNLGTLVEQAITGVQSITMTDANYTLTNFNGITNEARNAVLVVTGTNNAVRDLIPPVVEKLYTIANNTTGGFAIRVIGVSGTGVSIPNGATCLVFCDGTNFVNGLSGSAGNFSVAGDATVSGNLTVTGSSTIAPIGSILMWSTGSAPTGYLLCNGTAVSRATYAALFGVIGTTFGAGDTTTTFNLPNYTNRMPYGTTVGATGGSTTITAANLPSHTHTVVGNTGGQSTGHTHTISDPGHTHRTTFDYVSNGPGTLDANASGPPQNVFKTEINGAFTGITGTNNVSNDHTHSINLTSGPTGSGDAFITPYLGISFIIKF
jgi:microcystin-dependent protein